MSIKRRDFMALLGGAAVASPGIARAQQARMPVIGFLGGGSPEMFTEQLAKFRLGLGETGWTEGRNVRIEFRWAQGEFGRLPALAAELVSLDVTAIAATGGSAPPQAAKAATTTIPIVFTSGDDPVQLGFVAALNRPGGIMTGVSLFTGSLAPKRLQLLREVAPGANAIAFLVDPKNPTAELQQRDAEAAASELGLKLHVLTAGTVAEIETAFANLVELRAQAILVGDSPFFLGGRDKLIAFMRAPRDPGDFPVAGIRRRRRPRQLRDEPRRRLPADGRLYRPRAARREARRTAGASAERVRARRQSEDGQDAGHRHPDIAAGRGRRGHRMSVDRLLGAGRNAYASRPDAECRHALTR
jgi:putative ABC transport system substrate-binding protein